MRLGLHSLFVMKTFVDAIQILPKTPGVDPDAVIVLDSFRRRNHLIDPSGDTVNDATLTERIAQARVLIQHVHEAGLSL